jgi:hypothetical protein
MDRPIQRREAEREAAAVLKLTETEISSIVAAGGARYVGILRGIPGNLESVVLFSSPRTRTTLSLPISCLTVEAVRGRLAESDAAFAGAGAKCEM